MSGYLTSSGTDLSSIFMNINRYGQMIKYDISLSPVTVTDGNLFYTGVSCTLQPGTYIISLFTYNTTTTSSTGNINAVTIGISTFQTTSSTGGFQFSSGSLEHPNNGFISILKTRVLKVTSPITYYLNQIIYNGSTNTILLIKSSCYIQSTRIY
jgi:hypothetical protein